MSALSPSQSSVRSEREEWIAAWEREMAAREWEREFQQYQGNAIDHIYTELCVAFRAEVKGPWEAWKKVRTSLMEKHGSKSLAYRIACGKVAILEPLFSSRHPVALALRLDQALLLTANVKLLDHRTKGMFQEVVNRLMNLVNTVAKTMQAFLYCDPLPSDIVNQTYETTARELSDLYTLFLGRIGSVAGRSKLWTPLSEDDSAISHLVQIIKNGFVRLIANFSLENWSYNRGVSPFIPRIFHSSIVLLKKTKTIPSLSINELGVDEIQAGLSTIESEVTSTFPSEKATVALGKLQNTSENVSGLRDETQKFIASLEPLVELIQWICSDALAIRTMAKSIFNDFNKYSGTLIAALPFFEFLPYNERNTKYVTKAEYYLASRRLKSGVKFAHFLAAFDILLASFLAS